MDSVVVEKGLTEQADGVQHLPIQIGHLLAGFQGEAVIVEAKGQCAFLALFASTTNHNSPQLKNNVGIVTGATELKMSIYALMMVNLRRDVELELIDPIEECAKHYWDRPLYTSSASAAAALYDHYDGYRKMAVDKHVPPTCWVGPNELRAMAQYLREPIFVFDTDESKDSHVQRYGYQQHHLADGTNLESRNVAALSDKEAQDYLKHCGSCTLCRHLSQFD
ncbi:hypothetical protein PC110_g10702 [Phytophthora cactorum]|uniref:Uncharacterized protein n=1 Tax=Phytophthora cactorum TaxID=29920 RepID=A0A329S8N9_9STRA|nr:hypothetical protein PC110_g10702 [Phytophthora cactorum]